MTKTKQDKARQSKTRRDSGLHERLKNSPSFQVFKIEIHGYFGWVKMDGDMIIRIGVRKLKVTFPVCKYHTRFRPLVSWR